MSSSPQDRKTTKMCKLGLGLELSQGSSGVFQGCEFPVRGPFESGRLHWGTGQIAPVQDYLMEVPNARDRLLGMQMQDPGLWLQTP